MRRILILAGLILFAACAGRILKFEQYSMAMSQEVSADSSILLGGDESFQGVIWIGPILKEENVKVKSVKFIENYGKYFLSAENFKNVWMIKPKNDGMTGGFKAIDVTPDNAEDILKGISFSRYGTKENTCVRLQYNEKTIFIDREGNLNEQCN